MKKIIGLIITLVPTQAYGVKFNIINNMPQKIAHFRLEHRACGAQDYYFNPQTNSEFVPKTIPGTILSKEKSCCVKKLFYIRPNQPEIELANETSLNDLGRKNGSGDNCSGTFTITLATDGTASIR